MKTISIEFTKPSIIDRYNRFHGTNIDSYDQSLTIDDIQIDKNFLGSLIDFFRNGSTNTSFQIVVGDRIFKE